HCLASRSHAAIEYVATTGSAIGELGQIEPEQVTPLFRYEDGRYFWPRERRAHVLGRCRAHDDGTTGLERLDDWLQVGDAFEDECLLRRHGRVTLDRKLRHTPPTAAPPALPHSVTESPGSISST